MITLQLHRIATTNLTRTQQVAKEHVGLDALPGYVLAVFERREQGGAVFSRLVNSGESFSPRSRIPFRDLSRKYFAIAVNDSVLKYAFDHSIVLEDGSEEFTIKFHLNYRVADPRKVAEILEHDPLQQLRDEVARVIGRNCAKRKAEMFRDRFRDLERIVIDSESVRLRPYAAELGFKIISIDLDKPLPDNRGQINEGRQKAEATKDHYEIESSLSRLKRHPSRTWKHELKEDREHYSDAQQRESETELSKKMDELHRAEQNRRLRETQTDAVAQALSNVGSHINMPPELREGFEVTHEIAEETGGSAQPDDDAVPAAAAEVEESQRAGGDAETKGIDDDEPTTSDSRFVDEVVVNEVAVDEVVAESLLMETWKSEASRFIRSMAQAGADSDTTTRVREDLETLAARYFPPADRANSDVTTLPDDAPGFDSVIDSVMCSVFAPPTASTGANILVQVFAHLIDDSESVKTIASEFDAQANRLAAKPLNNPVERNSKLTFCISLPGLKIDEPVQELEWRGRPDGIQFGIHVPEDFKAQAIVGTICVSQNSVPFGHAKFLLRIVDCKNDLAGTDIEPEETSSWKPYKYAFISYATADRPEVLKRVQMLPRFHIDFFQDVLTLEPGEQWEKTIYENIDRSDVFFLFWSSAARNSERVMDEIRHALKRRDSDLLAAPEIVPVIIEGPPPVPPPAELKDVHFNDRFIYFMNAAH